MEIIDIHVHMNSQFQDIFEFNWNDLLKYLEHVEQVGLMPILTRNSNSIEINKDFFQKITEIPNSQIISYFWGHPDQVTLSIVTEFKPDGLKFHPSIGEENLLNCPHVVEIAEKLKIPLLVHCGRNERSLMRFILSTMEIYTDVKIIGAHLGGLATQLILRALNEIKTSQIDKGNLYLDTSGVMNPKLLRLAQETVTADNILYGTDIPFHDPQISLYTISLAFPDREIRQKVLYSNAQRLFNIKSPKKKKLIT